MREGRGRGDVRLVPADFSGVRELFAALKRGEAVGFLPDQVPGIGEGEWAEFFGQAAYTATLAPKLARRADVACFLAYAKRLPRGAGYAHRAAAAPAGLPEETPARPPQPRARGAGARMPRAVPLGLQPLQDAARREAQGRT